jgi:hypothetical protein
MQKFHSVNVWVAWYTEGFTTKRNGSPQKSGASTPGIEPGIFRSVGGRLIHWAMRNEAQEDFMLNWMHNVRMLYLYTQNQCWIVITTYIIFPQSTLQCAHRIRLRQVQILK